MHFLLAQNNLFTDNRLVRRGKLVHMSLLIINCCCVNMPHRNKTMGLCGKG